MPPAIRPFCADISRDAGEGLAATASRVEHWLVVEYPGLWSRDVLGGSLLPDPVKQALREQIASLPHARLLFVRRPDRRSSTRRRVYAARTRERGSEAFGFEIDDYAELVDVDFRAVLGGGPPGERIRHPLLVVCTHGKRDRCCARYGRPLYERLRDWVNEDWVWQSTHVGGDRFAGNLVCLPEGLYFGRIAAADAWVLADEYLEGRIYLDRYRGRSCHPFPAQAAERIVREETGLVRLDEVTVSSWRRLDDVAWAVQVEANGSVHDVRVQAEHGDLTYLTCDATGLKHPRRFVARTG